MACGTAHSSCLPAASPLLPASLPLSACSLWHGKLPTLLSTPFLAFVPLFYFACVVVVGIVIVVVVVVIVIVVVVVIRSGPFLFPHLVAWSSLLALACVLMGVLAASMAAQPFKTELETGRRGASVCECK